MKEINRFISVSQIFICNKGVVFGAKEEKGNGISNHLFLFLGDNAVEIMNEEIWYCYPFLNGFLYEYQRGNGIYFSDFEHKRDIAPASSYITLGQRLIEKKLLVSEASGSDTFYFLKKNFSIEEVPESLHYETNYAYIRDQVLNRHIIFAYDKETYSPLWETDISGFGVYLDDYDNEKPNEIEGDLMSYDNLLYVPLIGSQLVALNTKTREKEWMYDPLRNRRGACYCSFEDVIYMSDGSSLSVIDGKQGKLITKKRYRDDADLRLVTFRAKNDFWVYQDVVIMYGSYNPVAIRPTGATIDNQIIILDRSNLQVIDLIPVQGSVATGKDEVIWYNNRLYVREMNETLRVFELDLPKTIT